MTTGATGQLGLALPVQGELSGTWGDTVNNGITQYTNIAIAGTLTLTNDGAVTLANTTGDASASNITSTLTGAGTVTAQFAIVRVTGTLTVAKVVTGPAYSKTYTVVNAATGGIVTFKAAGQTGVSVAVGESAFVYFNGTDYVKLVGTATAGAAGGSNTQVQFNSSGILSGSSGLTWDGTTLSSTQVNITGQGTLRLQDTTGGEYVGLRSPSALGASYTLTFPADDGTSGQALITDGSGVLSWSTAASGDVYGPGSSTDNAVARFDSTTGKLLQNSVVIVGDTGAVTGVTDLAASGSVTLSGGTANGVTYLNGSKVLTSGSDFTFDGTYLTLGATQYLRVQTTTARGNVTIDADLVSENALAILATSTTYGQSSQLIRFVNSAAAYAGSISQTASTGIGLYSAGELVFGASSAEQMRLTSTGLGIGTSSPTQKLDVYAGGNGTGVRISNPTFGSNASPNYTELFFGLQNYSTGYASSIRGYNSGLDNFNSFLTFNTCSSNAAPTERMRLDSAGNLGLGVTPSAWGSSRSAIDMGANAYVGGTALSHLTNNVYFNGTNFIYKTTAATGMYQIAGAAHQWYSAASGTAGNTISFTQAMTLSASGYLGIAQTSPTTYLDILGSNGVARFNSSDSTGTYISFANAGVVKGYIGNSNQVVTGGSANDFAIQAPNNFLIATGGSTERVQINSVGTFILKNDYQEQTFTANSSTAITLNIVTNGTDQVITLTGTATITMPTATAGKSFLLKLKTGAGGYTVTWSTVKWPSGTAPTLTSTASRMDIFSFFADGTNWYGTTVGQNYTP